jgi:hypothetical protein
VRAQRREDLEATAAALEEITPTVREDEEIAREGVRICGGEKLP